MLGEAGREAYQLGGTGSLKMTSGPQVMNLPPGTNVYSNQETEGMIQAGQAAAGGAASERIIQAATAGGGQSAAVTVSALKEALKEGLNINIDPGTTTVEIDGREIASI